MKTIYLIPFFILSALDTQAFLSQEPIGWLWYRDPPMALKKEPGVPRKKTPTEEIDALRREFEDATARALLAPTFDNVRMAQRLQTHILNRADTFSRMWQWVVLQDASHWQQASHPNRVHQEIYKEQTAQKLKHNLRTLSLSYGLFLLFKANCPYCHAFAPIVKAFADQYGFTVKAVSADGGRLTEFPSAVLDNGTIRKLNPEGIFPALFLINPSTKDVIPLSWGMNALSVLEEQAQLVFEHRKDLLAQG